MWSEEHKNKEEDTAAKGKEEALARYRQEKRTA